MDQTINNLWKNQKIFLRDVTPSIKVTWSKLELKIDGAQVFRRNYSAYPNPKNDLVKLPTQFYRKLFDHYPEKNVQIKWFLFGLWINK